MALEQPKKPVGGAFGQFLAEKRPEFAKACEGKKGSEVSKMAGHAWKDLSDSARVPYAQKFAAAAAKYEEDMAAFLAAGGEKKKGLRALRSAKRKGKASKKAKDPNMPKKPVGGAYGVYLAENRAKIAESLPKDHKITDVAKAAGDQWKNLSEDAKRPYEAKYVQKKGEYEKAFAEYKAANPDVEEPAEAKNDAKAAKSLLRKSVGAKRRANTDTTSPSAKRGRVSKKGASSKEAEIDADVLKEAERLSFVSQIKNLAARPDVISSGKSQKDMLDALKTSDGLVNKAKSLLLTAAGA
jgi:hypothetical protein